MALSEAQVDQAARIIAATRTGRRMPIGHLPEACRPAGVEDALAIQAAAHRLLQQGGLGRVVGTKIGCTTRVMQHYLGVDHPCVGGIFEATVQHGRGEVRFDDFLHPGVECEIAVTLSADVKATDAPHDLRSVSQAVEAVFPAIEIVDDRYVDFAQREPDWRTWLADDFFGAGIVLGNPLRDWRELELPEIRGVMRMDGEELGSGHGRDIINGHPLEALVWLANHQAARGRDLPAGWIVMLGSVVQTNWVNRGSLVEIEIEGLGKASARFG